MRICTTLLFIAFINYQVSAQDNFVQKLCDAATELTKHNVTYDPKYISIAYPNGDVPENIGVCTDVIVRAYRKLGIDLQKEVHEDMVQNFSLYPKDWGLKRPDSNIDHRRVPNLMTFFSRHGQIKKISQNPDDYVPGDIVTWDLGGYITHIGIVINQRSAYSKNNLIVHNIGYGQKIDDILFKFKIIGHYTYNK
jgi:uncharacterized protein